MYRILDSSGASAVPDLGASLSVLWPIKNLFVVDNQDFYAACQTALKMGYPGLLSILLCDGSQT